MYLFIYFAKILVSSSFLEMPNTSKSDEAHIRDSQHISYFNSVLHLKIIKITSVWEAESGCKIFKKDKLDLVPRGRDSKLSLLSPRKKKIIFLQVEIVPLKPNL